MFSKFLNDKSSVNYMLKISGFAYCIKHFVNLSLLLQNMSQYLTQKYYNFYTMAKVKYYYDPESLSYQKIRPKKGENLKKLLLTLASATVFMILGFVFFSNIF
jgi:hypothetical protein